MSVRATPRVDSCGDCHATGVSRPGSCYPANPASSVRPAMAIASMITEPADVARSGGLLPGRAAPRSPRPRTSRRPSASRSMGARAPDLQRCLSSANATSDDGDQPIQVPIPEGGHEAIAQAIHRRFRERRDQPEQDPRCVAEHRCLHAGPLSMPTSTASRAAAADTPPTISHCRSGASSRPPVGRRSRGSPPHPRHGDRSDDLPMPDMLPREPHAERQREDEAR